MTYICPYCGMPISEESISRHLASRGGRAKSPAKTEAARRNSLKGGRKKKNPPQQTPAEHNRS